MAAVSSANGFKLRDAFGDPVRLSNGLNSTKRSYYKAMGSANNFGDGGMFRKSDFFILAATALSFFLSVYLWFTGDKESGLFVGIWVPSIIGVGIFIKLATLRGRDNV